MWYAKALAVLRRDSLLYVVCTTGAVVLAVEVMAVRVLAPYFGNTIFAFSSVLCVILCALAVGYRYGGVLADKRPEPQLFYFFVWLSGVSVLAVYTLSLFILPILGMLPITYGPLVASFVIFFVPACFFGLLSPFVVALRSRALPERGVGTVSGEVFFWSTLGSIAGSLGSGFLLVPYVGIHYAMLLLGGLVAGIGVVGLYRTEYGRATLFAGISVVLVVCGVWAHSVVSSKSVFEGAKTLYAKDGYYEHIRVIEGEYFNTTARVLMLDKSFSSGVRWPSGDLLFPYTHYIDLYQFFNSRVQRALVMGAGTGTVANALHERYPRAHIDMVDVEPTLFELAEQYFGVRKSSKIHAYVADGRQFLRAQQEQYDMVFGDMYSGYYAVPWHVATREFYELLYSKLAPGGVYIGNYILAFDETTPSLYGSTLRTLHEVFDVVYVFAVQGVEEKGVQNVMILGVRTGERTPTLTQEALLQYDMGLLAEYAPHLHEYDEAVLDGQYVLTDDKATTDSLLALQFMRSN